MINRILLVMVLLISTSLAFANNQYQRVYDIYNRILTANQINHYPYLRIQKSSTVNAETNGITITFYTGLLYALYNDDEIAFVLAHELGHNLNTTVNPEQKEELRADKIGKRLLISAGYNVCKGVQFLKRMNPTSTPESDHPSGYERAKALGCR